MQINQNSKVNNILLNSLLSKYGRYDAKFDTVSIEDDIKLIENKRKNVKDKLRIKSYDEIEKYLKRILKDYTECDSDTLEILFETDGKRVGGFPFETIKIKEPKLVLDLEYLDYLKFDTNSYIIRLNYSELMSGLALELAREDLGIEIEEVEDELENTSLVSVNDARLLDKFIGDTDLSSVVAEFKIGDSEYYDRIRKVAKSYFLDKVRDNVSYADMMDATMKKAMALIICNLLSNFSEYDCENNRKLSLLAVYDDELVLSVDKVDKGLIDILNQPVCALTLGRKFGFNTVIQILEHENRKE